MVRRLTAAIAVGVLLASSIPAFAQDVPTGNTLTIPQAIDLAWKNNISTLNSESTLKQAQADYLGSRSTYLPNLSLSTGWSRNSPARLVETPRAFVESQNSYSFNLQLRQPIFDGFGFIYTPRSHAANVSRGRAQLRSTRQDVASQVKAKCYDLLKAQMLSDVREKSVKQAQEQLETSKARYDLGSASLSDFLKSKVQLGNDSLALIQAQNDIEVKRATLNDYLGLPVNRKTEIDAKMDLEDYKIPPLTDQLAAVSTHPDVEAAQYSLNMANANVGAATAARFPSVTASANYNYSTGVFPQVLDDIWYEDRASIGISINYTIFSGYSTTASIRKAKVQKVNAEDALAQTKRTVALAITTAALQVDVAQRSYQVSLEQVRSAEEDHNIAQEKYNLGAATILDVLDAQVSLSQAETNKINAIFDFNTAVSELEKAMGKGD